MKKILLITVSVITLLVVAKMYWWLKNALQYDSFDVTMEEFLKVFPDFLQNGRSVALLTVLLSGTAVGLTIYLIYEKYKLILTLFLLIVNGIILSWNIFSLM